MNLLFVYGTLRSGHDNTWAKRLHEASDYEGPGVIAGSLYRIAHYPGLVEDDPGGEVHGELWRIRDFQPVVAALDDYEGSEYSRVVRQIRKPDGGNSEAWVYIFVASIENKPRILSGDWTHC